LRTDDGGTPVKSDQNVAGIKTGDWIYAGIAMVYDGTVTI
jgi:hypothetical protein